MYLLVGGLFFFFKFLMRTIFNVFIVNLLQYCLCSMFWFFGQEMCGILAPLTGIEPTTRALEGEF